MPVRQFQDNILILDFQGESLDYAAYQLLKESTREVQNEADLRGLALVINCESDHTDDMGEIPEEYKHRNPRGSHGLGPIIEQDTLNALFRCTKPTVAFLTNRINGSAMDIASFCDIRWVRSDVCLCDDRIHRSKTASTGITYLLPRLVGLSQAMRFLLLGETFDAKQLVDAHFAHRLVPSEEWDQELKAFCSKIGGMATRAYEVHKMQVIPQLDIGHDAAMVHSLGVRQTHVIKDRLEGIQAWRERRDPVFEGE